MCPFVPATIPSAGAAAPITREVFNTGASLSIANNGGANLAFGTSSGPNVLFDRTDVTNPIAIASGVYAVSVVVDAFEDMTANGYFQADLSLDSEDEAVELAWDSRLATVARPRPEACATGVFYMAANSGILLRVTNRDGAAARLFGIGTAFIQRIS